jgi:hypothetical protein
MIQITSNYKTRFSFLFLRIGAQRVAQLAARTLGARGAAARSRQEQAAARKISKAQAGAARPVSGKPFFHVSQSRHSLGTVRAFHMTTFF